MCHINRFPDIQTHIVDSRAGPISHVQVFGAAGVAISLLNGIGDELSHHERARAFTIGPDATRNLRQEEFGTINHIRREDLGCLRKV
jgi:hypothetical protein